MMIFSIAVAFMVSSCTWDKSGKKRSTGKTNEILIVTNNQKQWESPVGETIREFFEQDMIGLPQPEAIFYLFNIPESAMNKIFRRIHNIFIVDINPDITKPLIEIKRNLWARPQMVIKITAPDEGIFISLFLEHRERFLKLYNDLEIQRTNEYFSMAKSVSLTRKLKNKFGLSLDIPGGFAIAYEDKDFIWLRQTLHKAKQDAELGIMVYTYNYNNTSAFSPENIITVRDSITKRHVPGPTKGSFMAVSDQFFPPVFTRTSDFTTDFAVETRGLWKVVNDFMGGPFISYTFVDPEHERVITLDGYVYNPNGLKRNFVRQLEAIFNTLKFEEKSGDT
jgi:hypothetical protein